MRTRGAAFGRLSAFLVGFLAVITELIWRWLPGWRNNPWRARCCGCGWPIMWAWHQTVSGQRCRNCQPKLSRFV